jgi:hypothetical protein
MRTLPAWGRARLLMPARAVPARHWRRYGNRPLPSGEEVLDEPLRAFPSWFLRMVCALRQGAADLLAVLAARRHADPGHHRPHAARVELACVFMCGV